MRILSLVVIILGIAAMAFGVIFVLQANAGNDEIIASIAPLTLDQVEPKYDAVSAKYDQVKTAEEPAIQGGTAAPSAMYNYLSSQRALLGLAKANIATVKVVRSNAFVTIGVGLGLVLAGFATFRKSGE
jgi:hypothetical protein